MKRFSTSKIVLLLTIGLIPAVSKAQVPGFFKRLQLGYTIPMEKATYTRTFPVTNTATLKLDDSFRDTTIQSVISPTSSVGGLLGSYIRLAKLGKASTLNFSMEANIRMLTWDNEESEVTTPDINKAQVITGKTTAIGLPLGFDVKFGADAYPDKSYRWCTGFGFGFNSGSVATTLNGESNSEIFVRPYLRAEAGILGGMCFKVRATYTFGKQQYMRSDNSSKNNQGNIYPDITLLNSKSSFDLSFIIMPFASKWDSSRWWK